MVGGILNFVLFRISVLARIDTSVPVLTMVVFVIGAVLALKMEKK